MNKAEEIIQNYIKNKSNGNLDLSHTSITSLPENLKVGGSLFLYNTKIASLPKGLKVKRNLHLRLTPITSLPKGLKVGGYLDLRNSLIASLPDGLEVGGDLDLHNTPIISLPDDLKVGGYLNLSYTEITSLPKGLKVGGYLKLRHTPITSLPNGLKVEGSLFLHDTPIKKVSQLPLDLEVGGEIISEHFNKSDFIKYRDELTRNYCHQMGEMSILEEAMSVTSGERRRDYDAALPNHERIASLWNAYLNCRAKDAGEPITALDAAHMMILLKLARACKTPTRDTYVDIAGYARCAAEISGLE